MGLDFVGLFIGDFEQAVYGPVSPDQATILSAVSTTTPAIALIHPEPPLVDDEQQEYADGGEAAVAAAACADDLHVVGPDEDAVGAFIASLSAQLGVDCTVRDGVIHVGESPSAAEFSAMLTGTIPGMTKAHADAVAAFAELGLEPNDFITLTAGELLYYAFGGAQLALRKDGDGFYVSDDVALEIDSGEANEPDCCENIPEGTIQLADGTLVYPAPIAGAPELPQFEQRADTAEREDILLDAASTVTDGRNTLYGHPQDALAGVADYWNLYLEGQGQEGSLTAHDVAMMMALLKVSRIQDGDYNRDNYVDGAGYLAIAGEAHLDAVTDPFNPNGKTVH